jgi:hypothetical protein
MKASMQEVTAILLRGTGNPEVIKVAVGERKAG